MEDFDLIAVNTFLSLAKGDIESPIAQLGYKKQFIEEKVKSTSGRIFPADLILFSKKYNHAWVMEVKDISTSDFNVDQAHGYRDLNHESLKRALPEHRELPRVVIDVTYQGHIANENHLAAGLKDASVAFPLLVFDHNTFQIKKSVQAGDFQFARIKKVFEKELALNIDDLDKVTPYIKFSTETDNYKVAQTVVPELVKQTRLLPQDSEIAVISIERLTKDCYSLLGDGLWNQLNPEYRRNLVRKTRTTLIQLRDNGLSYIKIREDKFVGIDLYGANGDLNQATLTAIKSQIEQAGPALFRTQEMIF